MLDASVIEAGLRLLPPEQLRAALANFLPQGATPAERISAIEGVLQSPAGQSMRDAMARWIVDGIVPVERLVPAAYLKWRPPVRDAMMFVVSHLSPARLAPKLLEQIELPAETTPEARLLRLIAKVPGLQKLGQVIARNQHLRPALRNALARLENGIRDVQPEETVRAIAGHVSEKSMRYYSHIRIVAKKRAVDCLVPAVDGGEARKPPKKTSFPLLAGVEENARRLGIPVKAALELLLAYERSKASGS